MHRVGFSARALVAGLAFLLFAACSNPHRRPKTLAGIGTALAAVGGATWVVGDRSDRNAVATAGLATVAIGAGVLLVAGVLMAVDVACRADADCPSGEECREVPAAPGGVPYAQCVPHR